MASNLLAMASILEAMAFNLIAMASNLLAMAANLLAMAFNLLAMAFNLVAVASSCCIPFEPIVLFCLKGWPIILSEVLSTTDGKMAQNLSYLLRSTVSCSCVISIVWARWEPFWHVGGGID